MRHAVELSLSNLKAAGRLFGLEMREKGCGVSSAEAGHLEHARGRRNSCPEYIGDLCEQFDLVIRADMGRESNVVARCHAVTLWSQPT